MIFVFGSNLMGIHGAGAALTAKKEYGAIQGKGHGRQGNSYAIPTKYSPYVRMELLEIEGYVKGFLRYAHDNPNEFFYLTAIGTGLAGYTHDEIAPMFMGLSKNVQPPAEWYGYLYKEFK